MTAKVHVHLHVGDLEASRRFYETAFGAPVKSKPGYVKFLPDFAPLNLALSQWTSAPTAPRSVTHYGIQFDSPAQVVEHLARVKKAGLAVREEMGVNCCHANQDKFWVRDPDGNEWEFYHLNYDLESSSDDCVSATKSGEISIAAPAGCCSAPQRTL